MSAVAVPPGPVNIFIYAGPQDWTEIALSTPTVNCAVVLSSSAILLAGTTTCYNVGIYPNGTTSATKVVCPK